MYRSEEVNSSFISRVSFASYSNYKNFSSLGCIFVHIKKALTKPYDYQGFTHGQYLNFLKTNSKGKFFNKHIKNK